jgi:hypothetical protein
MKDLRLSQGAAIQSFQRRMIVPGSGPAAGSQTRFHAIGCVWPRFLFDLINQN